MTSEYEYDIVSETFNAHNGMHAPTDIQLPHMAAIVWRSTDHAAENHWQHTVHIGNGTI